MDKTPDNALIRALKDEKSHSFKTLYRDYYPLVRTFVANRSGTPQDAEDVFQEAVVVLLQKMRQDNFVLTSSFRTFFIAIARNIWLKRLRDNRILPVENIEKYQKETDFCDIEVFPGKTNEEKVKSWLAKISQHCQRILKAIFFYNDAMKIVSKRMGWKNAHTAANQKYKCIEQVKKARNKLKND